MEQKRFEELVEDVRKMGNNYAYGWLAGAVRDFLSGIYTETELRARYEEITAAGAAAQATK